MSTHITALTDILSAIMDLCQEAKVDKEVRPGPEATHQNSLVITILILKSLFGFNSERAFLRYLGKHHRDIFPSIPEQSWFNRKAKKLVQKEKMIHKLMLQKLGARSIKIRIVDSTGIPVVKLHRARNCKSFQKKTEVNFGYCKSKDTYYYGQKLTLSVTPEGIPTSHILTPANLHDVRALKENISTIGDDLKNKTVIGDKGYYDSDLETTLKEDFDSRLVVPDKKRHQQRNTKKDKKLLRRRSIIETVNEQLQDHMRVDDTKAKSNLGLASRIQSILLSFTFGIYFNMLQGRDLLAIKSIVI